MFKNFFPNKILSLNNKLISSLLIAMILVIVVGLIYALFISPPDYIQGDSVRIMYVHVPASFIALGSFGFIGIASILNLVFKIKFMPLMAKSLAPVGCIFSLVSIVTGSLWGKPTWGTWWVWDARLTSELILLFIYISIIVLHNSFDDYRKGAKTANILAIVGFINIPIIHFSVEWWNTLHQGPSVIKFGLPSISPEMLYPLIYVSIGFTFYFITSIFLSARNTLLLRERNKQWVNSI